MQTPSFPNNVRRILARGLATGLLLSQSALPLFGQAAPAAPTTTDTTPVPAATTTTTTTTTNDKEKKKTAESVVQLETYTVLGSYAGSLEMAAQAKQNNAALVEVIVPEDIGKLPDVSIADALNRLTGLTSQRVNGRDQEINIRGFSPDFSVGTLDGVEQATTDGNRAVQYDQYPSELVGGVTVYKTGQADLSGGLAGTVDLETTSPLSFGHSLFAASAYYNWSELGQQTPGVKKAGESYNLSYINQFADDTEGIFVGYAHTENPYEGQQFQSWGYPTDSSGNLILGGMKIYAQSELLKRDSAVVVLESKPNENIHSKLDVFLSYFNDLQLLRGMEIPMNQWGPAQLQPGYTITGGLYTNYTDKNLNPVIRNMVTAWKAHMASAVWNLDLAEKSAWPVHVQAGWSKATQKNEVLETYAGLGFNNQETDPDTMVITQNAGPNPPQVVSSTDYSDASLFFLTDPDGYGVGTYPGLGQSGYLKYYTSDDVADSIKGSTKHELDASIFKDLELGVSYSQRFKQFGQNISDYVLNSNGMALEALPPLIGTTNLSFVGNLRPVAFDPNAALNGGFYSVVPNPNPGNYEGDNYKASEDVARPYFKFDLKGNAGSVPFDGNLGIMADLAKQSSTGFSGNGSTILFPVSASASYADILPSLNLIFRPTDKDLIRLFVGRQEQRPRMYDMRASRDYGYNPTLASSTTLSPWSGNAGNPNLRPWVADSIDLDYEHYFAKGGGYFSLALFEKKLLSYIYQQQTLTDFSGYPYTSAQAPVLNQGFTSSFVNGQGGNVRGIEATLQITSEAVTGGAVRGFGVVLNGLLVDSTIQPWGPGNGSAPLPDMSKKTMNMTFFYERYGFSARISNHYQSQAREYIVQFGAPNFAGVESPSDGYSEELPFHQIDAQVSYAFSKGPLKGLTFYLNGRNLNNAALVTYTNGDPRQLANWQKYGAAYRAGVSYKF